MLVCLLALCHYFFFFSSSSSSFMWMFCRAICCGGFAAEFRTAVRLFCMLFKKRPFFDPSLLFTHPHLLCSFFFSLAIINGF